MRTVIATMEPQPAPVPVKLPTGTALDVSRLSTGPILRCTVTAPQGEGRASMRVYAHEGDVEVLDLSTLRLGGRTCDVGPWEPKPPHEGITGPLLCPLFSGDPEPKVVSLEFYLPRIIQRWRS